MHFGETYRLHFQGLKTNQAGNKNKQKVAQICLFSRLA
jgi:hypothetical protein